MSNKKRAKPTLGVYPAALLIPVLGGPHEVEDLTHMIISMCEFCSGPGLDGFIADLDQKNKCTCGHCPEINSQAVAHNIDILATSLRAGTGVTT